jgi:hypothetical protein
MDIETLATALCRSGRYLAATLQGARHSAGAAQAAVLARALQDA